MTARDWRLTILVACWWVLFATSMRVSRALGHPWYWWGTAIYLAVGIGLFAWEWRR